VRWQGFYTVAGMIAVITRVLAGATIGLLAAVVSDHSLAASLATGCLFALGHSGGTDALPERSMENEPSRWSTKARRTDRPGLIWFAASRPPRGVRWVRRPLTAA
jgi:hypothetical protein